MENKRWFEEQLSAFEEFDNYIETVFFEYLDEMGYETNEWTYLNWEPHSDDEVSVIASHYKDYEDSWFYLNKNFFYEGHPERRRSEMAMERRRKERKKQKEQEELEQKRMEQKRKQFEKLKQELGES